MAEVITKVDVNIDDVVQPALKAGDAVVKWLVTHSDAGVARLTAFAKTASELKPPLPSDVFVLEAARLADLIPAGAVLSIETDQLTDVEQLDENRIRITATAVAGPIVLGGFLFENIRTGQARAANRLKLGIDVSFGRAYVETVGQRIDKSGMAQQLNVLGDLMKQKPQTP